MARSHASGSRAARRPDAGSGVHHAPGRRGPHRMVGRTQRSRGRASCRPRTASPRHRWPARRASLAVRPPQVAARATSRQAAARRAAPTGIHGIGRRHVVPAGHVLDALPVGVRDARERIARIHAVIAGDHARRRGRRGCRLARRLPAVGPRRHRAARQRDGCGNERRLRQPARQRIVDGNSFSQGSSRICVVAPPTAPGARRTMSGRTAGSTSIRPRSRPSVSTAGRGCEWVTGPFSRRPDRQRYHLWRSRPRQVPDPATILRRRASVPVACKPRRAGRRAGFSGASSPRRPCGQSRSRHILPVVRHLYSVMHCAIQRQRGA